MFVDRRNAGRLLAERLQRFRDEDPVIVALPRGGVVVGFEVASALGAPLDVLVVRKVGAPGQSELAVGAVADGDPPVVVHNEALLRALGLARGWVDAAARVELALVRAREVVYREGRPRVPLEGRTAIVVDDGIATGATTRAALMALRTLVPRRLVLAVPLAPADTLRALRPEVDEVVCLSSPWPFVSVGSHYADFDQTTDDDVIQFLASLRDEPTTHSGAGSVRAARAHGARAHVE